MLQVQTPDQNVDAGHEIHCVLSILEYVPAEQFAHNDAPILENVPIWQLMQAEELVAFVVDE